VGQAVEYTDLGATVHPDGLPDGAAAELDGLYESLMSTADWFATRESVVPDGACLLDRPRHVLPFTIDGDTVEVLNRTFAIAPADAERACEALFRAVPQARRIHFDAMFPPGRLRLPTRRLETTDHMVVDLPAGTEAYRASLGKSTRQNLRLYENRLRRGYPDVHTEVMIPGDRGRELVDRFVSWKVDRFKELGRTTYWELEPDMAERFTELLRRRGEAHVTSAGGAEAAISFVFHVGGSAFALETAFAPAFEHCRLGFLAQYWVVCDAAERGAACVHLMWGTPTYKGRLGATPRPATMLSVFRHQGSRLWSLDEAACAAKARHPRAAERYEAARRAARRTAASAKRRAVSLMARR